MNGSVKLPEAPTRGLLSYVEGVLFRHRRLVLASLALFTLIMGWFAVQLRMDAGFEKQLPVGHEYIETFEAYRNDLLGANRLTIVVKAREGDIWSAPGLKRLYDVTQAVTFLPGVSRSSVRSLWTPNAFVNEITEEGFRADPLVPGTVSPEHLDDRIIAKIANSTAQGGFIGTLVSRDQSSAMITVELNEYDSQGAHLDYVTFNHRLEKEIRQRFEDGDFEIQIIGFAKQIGDIADGASAVLEFCLLALLLTAGAVYWYCHSLRFTLLALVCSLASLVWQFGSLRLLGYGLDPLAVLVPFLVFAIGVSHGVQQINFIVREIAIGKSAEEAARSSFTGLLVPGTLALVTALVSFVTLLLIPIPMVRELAITASLGVAYKIVTNLVMLPLMASLLRVDDKYAAAQEVSRQRRSRWLRGLARLAEPRKAQWVLGAALAVFLAAIWQSHDRVVGTLQAGAPELREDSRFNRDAVSIASNYDIGLDWLSVVFEVDKAPSEVACEDVALGQYQDRFVWAMQGARRPLGRVLFHHHASVQRGLQRRQPEDGGGAHRPDELRRAGHRGCANPGLMRTDCSMSAVHLYLADHKATTINRVVDAAKAFRSEYPMSGISIRLASGNAGVLAAINEEVEKSETPMLLYVYAAIALLVFVVYRDLRAVLVCCLPLTIGTFIGYWFMKELQIGLTIATLPVMVLAVGIGVDYAFYIYNRLQLHLAHGQTITKAVEYALLEVGVATIFTAITLAVGVATWAFSELKFQADMGKLLAFMFVVNMVMAMTVLPAFAVWLERAFPRKRPVRMIGALVH